MVKLRELIRADLARLAKPTLKNFFRYLFFPQGTTFPFCVWLRVLSAVKRNRILKYTLGIPVYFIYRHLSFKYAISVNSNTEIGPGLCIVHGFGVFLNCRSIGSHFTVYQNTTIGILNGEVPIIEDDVTVFTGSIVVGDVKLGKGTVVGANSYVNKSTRPGTTVAGSPAKEIK